MKKNILYKVFSAAVVLISLPLLFTSCIKDDGSYDYTDLPEITFENIPELSEVIAYVDHLKISPRFISSTEGEIKSGDPNWTVVYRFGHKGMGSMGFDEENQTSIAFEELKPSDGFNLDAPMEYTTGAYVLWITLIDNRNNSYYTKQFDVNISSATYEGWLVLCNDGADEVARLDMISLLPGNRQEAIYDVCKGLPTLHHATCINAFPQGSNPGDHINMFTREGSYRLDAESLESEPALEFNGMYFIFDPGETIIKEDVFAGSSYGWQQKYKLCFGENGNAYIKNATGGGAAYAAAVNTLKEGTATQFRVAPYCGYNWTRPWSSEYGHYILYYDIDNRRFLLYDGITAQQQLNVIPEPGAGETKLFSYSTGKDFVFMQSTRRSNGLVCTILQDPATGKRSIYGINLGGSGYAQELYVPEVNAPNFEQATQFAFDSRFPLLFYSVGNKLYCYNYATMQTKEIATQFAANEEITKLKFNLYHATDYTELANQSEAFMNQQYRLVVCTCSDDTSKGGKVTFFDVDGVNSTATQKEQFTGFGKIVDIVYRERCV